jgi:hypothetical protein
MKYIIEVQRIYYDPDDLENLNSYEHFGYINMKFTTLRETRKYIKEHNPQLRMKGSRYRGYLSSTDMLTKMRYLIRHYRDEKLSLQPF